jgi:hypothetical protein
MAASQVVARLPPPSFASKAVPSTQGEGQFRALAIDISRKPVLAHAVRTHQLLEQISPETTALRRLPDAFGLLKCFILPWYEQLAR